MLVLILLLIKIILKVLLAKAELLQCSGLINIPAPQYEVQHIFFNRCVSFWQRISNMGKIFYVFTSTFVYNFHTAISLSKG